VDQTFKHLDFASAKKWWISYQNMGSHGNLMVPAGIEAMAIEIVSFPIQNGVNFPYKSQFSHGFPIKNGGSFHGFWYVYQVGYDDIVDSPPNINSSR